MEQEFSKITDEFSSAVSELVGLLGMQPDEVSSYFSNEVSFQKFQQNVSFFQQHWNEIKQYAITGASGSHKDLIEATEKLNEQRDFVSKANLKIATLEKANSMQNAENIKLTLENVELQKQIEEYEKNTNQSGAVETKLKEQVSKLEKQLETYVKQLEISTKQLTEYKKISNNTKTEMTTTQQELINAKTQNQTLTNELSKMKSLMQKMGSTDNENKEIINNLQAQVEETRNENTQLTIDLTKCKAQLQQLQTVQNSTKSSAETLTQQLMDITTTNQQLESDLSKYKAQVTQLQSAGKQDQASIKALNEELENLTTENIQLKEKVQALENEPNRPDIVSLNQQITVLKGKLVNLTNENEEMSKELQNMDEKAQQDQENLQTLKKQATSTNTQASGYYGIIKTMKKRIEKLDSAISTIHGKIDSKFVTFNASAEKVVKDMDDFEVRQKAINVIHQKESKNSIKLLSYAITSLSNIAGVDEEAKPSVSSVLQNPQILVDMVDAMTRTVSDLKSTSVQKTFVTQSNHPHSTKSVSSSVGSMSSLMRLISQQMEVEHQELMSAIGDTESPSFRSAVQSSKI